MPNSAHLDKTRPVAPGEELDTQKLAAYLGAHVPELAGEITVAQFPGGHSNLTYLLKIAGKEVVLRRPPFGRKIKTAHDMGREYRILSKLVEVYPRVPRPYAYCEDESVLGAPFYIMQRVSGVVLRAKAPKDLELKPELMARLSRSLIDNLAEIHSLDYQAAGLGELGKPEGYIERQISGWSKRYRDAQTDDIPQIDAVIDWLADNMPPEGEAALIHNDYKYDNLILDPEDLSQIIGVLDWEMATLGDPLMDLGTCLTYWIDPDDPDILRENAFGPTILPGNLSRVQLAERYAEKSGRDLPDLLFYYVYGVFKLAVIAQQIYARYKTGHSKDERFASFIAKVHMLGYIAAAALEKGKISGFS